MESRQKLSSEEEQRLARLLSKLEPGFLPFNIFVQFARIVVMPIIEFVPLRYKDGRTEVLLLQRATDDPIWPGMVHTPGTVIRATDTEQNMYLAFQRILQDELQGTPASDPYYVGTILHKSRRGTEHAQIYWVEITGEPKTGSFHSVDALPGNLIESQSKFIQQAARSFRQQKGILATG